MSPFEQVRGAGDDACHPCESVNKWRTLLLRMQKKGVLPSSKAATSSPALGNHLYGRPLLSIWDENQMLPKPIRDMLTELWRRGPDTEGVFRKAGNAKRLSEVKSQIDAGLDLEAETLPVVLLAALLKDFLRQLPDALLGPLLYPAWMSAMEKEESQRSSDLKQVSEQLPKANVHLLQHLLLVLHHISQSSESNKMDARNLAVCISPNLLPPEHLSLDEVEKVTALTQFLIEHCSEIFGESLQTVAGGPAEVQLADSSDSLWSHGQDSAYESADPEAEAEWSQEVAVAPSSCLSSAGVSRRPSRPMGRRRSEPAMLRSAGMRKLLTLSRGNEGGQGETRPLRKQSSHDSFLLTNHSDMLQHSTICPVSVL